MRKILALVLAVAMLSTVAFAADFTIASGTTNVNPGTTILIEGANFVLKDKTDTLAGTKYYFSSEYFTVTTQKFDKGPGLVKSVKINDDDMGVEIALADNFELARPGDNAAPNLVIRDISVKAKKEYKGTDTAAPKAFAKGSIYKYDNKVSAFKVGYDVSASKVVELNNAPAYRQGEMVKFKAVGATVYADATFNEGDVYLEGRVYDKDKVYVKVDNKADTDVLKANENATIDFIKVTTNGFPTSNKIQITADEKAFIYKLVEGKLVESGLTWSADDYTWNGKIRSTTAYVISDIKLNAVAAAEDVKNPATGANDVVGIAAALAVVSLVAAGAVSLKK